MNTPYENEETMRLVMKIAKREGARYFVTSADKYIWSVIAYKQGREKAWHKLFSTNTKRNAFKIAKREVDSCSREDSISNVYVADELGYLQLVASFGRINGKIKQFKNELTNGGHVTDYFETFVCDIYEELAYYNH